MSQRGFRVCPPDMTGIAYRSAYGSSREPNLWTSITYPPTPGPSPSLILPLSLSHTLSHAHIALHLASLSRPTTFRALVFAGGRKWSLSLPWVESGHWGSKVVTATFRALVCIEV